MAQIHCYVPDQVAEKLHEKASDAHLSISKYLALLVKKDMGSDWPKDYFDIFGSWEGDDLQRPDQGDCEPRLELR